MSKFINYAKSRKVDYEEAEKVLDKAMDVVASCDKLGFKAKNELAQKFQAKLAREV